MKGSSVRVRASALGSWQGFLRRRQRRIAAVGYETGTSSDRFTVSEGVPRSGRFSLISRKLQSDGGSRWSIKNARTCPHVDRRDGLLLIVMTLAAGQVHLKSGAGSLDISSRDHALWRASLPPHPRCG